MPGPWLPFGHLRCEVFECVWLEGGLVGPAIDSRSDLCCCPVVACRRWAAELFPVLQDCCRLVLEGQSLWGHLAVCQRFYPFVPMIVVEESAALVPLPLGGHRLHQKHFLAAKFVLFPQLWRCCPRCNLARGINDW